MLNHSYNDYYAEGGIIKGSKKKKKQPDNLYPLLAEMIRTKGGEEDTILAHINPLENMILGLISGGGTINPDTELPQYGFFKKPFKAIKSVLGGAGGAILGNMILPGAGGVIGGALGGAAGSAIRGRKDFGNAALKGGLMGAAMPSLASLLGSGASGVGMSSAGNYLSNYGAKNAIMPSLGKLIGDNSVGNYIGSVGQGTEDVADAGTKASSKSWLSSMMKPKNMLTAATLAGSFVNRPKEKSPERLAQEQKRFAMASMLTPEERAAQEANLLGDEQMKRRIARNKYLPEERFEVKPLYRKANDPDEFARTGRWINYYDNAAMHGNPLLMKKGGLIPQMMIEKEEIEYPLDLGVYFNGPTGGQDDKINARMSHGEFVMPADVVADVGDGNSEAGAKAFHDLIKKVRQSKGRKNILPPKSKPLETYLRKARNNKHRLK